MEIGVSLPNMGPLANRDNIFRIADRAEELGLHSVWVGDHIAFPHQPRQQYPYSRGQPRPFIAESAHLDALTVLTAVAARTQRLKVGVGVLILPFRHPLISAKMAATIQELSGGRLILGVGVGWLSEEFDALGVPFAERGAISDEQLQLFQQLWYQEKPRFEGKYYQFTDMTFLPRPLKVPIWVGGNTRPAMRRAARFGDAIQFLDLTPQELGERIRQLHIVCKEAGRPAGEVMLALSSGIRMAPQPLPEAQRRYPLTGSLEQIMQEMRQYKGMGIQHMT